MIPDDVADELVEAEVEGVHVVVDRPLELGADEAHVACGRGGIVWIECGGCRRRGTLERLASRRCGRTAVSSPACPAVRALRRELGIG